MGPAMFMCENCGTKNTRMKQMELNGKQLSKWKCYACNYYFLEPDKLRDKHGRIMRKKKKGKERRHIDKGEHITHDMSELERFRGISDMLSKATSSLPYSAPSHYECRSDPPSWKSQMMLKRTVRHNVTAIRMRVGIRVYFNKYQNKVYKILFWVLLLSYPSTSTRALRIFQCEPIGDHYYLARDYTQKCFVGVWWFWQTWSIVCVVLYVVGIPSLFFALLYRASHMHVSERLQECERSDNRKKQLLKEAEADAMVAGRFYHVPTNPSEERAVITQYLRISNMMHHKVKARLGFIYECYEEESWWWEIVELLRKMFMNGVMCLLLPDSPTQIMIGMVITFVFMTITLQQRPYKCGSDHNLAFACHLQLFVTLLGGFLMREEVKFLGTMDVDNTIAPEVVGLIVVLSHAGVCAYGFFAILLERYFSDEQQRLRRAIKKNEVTRKRVLKKANRGFAVARQLAAEQVELKKQLGSRGLANNIAKKLEEDKKRRARLGGFGVHSLVEGGHHSALDKALGKFERKKTKVQPVRAAEKHDISTAGRALQWSAKGAGGKSLALAAGKALVETRKQVAPPPTEELNNKHGTDSETGSDHSGSSYETDSDGDSSSDSDSSSSESS